MSTSNRLPNIYTRSICNIFRRTPLRVGIVLSGALLPYSRATAVARLRVYDVIEMFAADSDVAVELCLPGRRYDLVIFEKTFTPQALELARKQKHQDIKVLLDVNVDYFSKSTPRVTDSMYKMAQEFAKVADGIIAPSERLVEELQQRQVHPWITYVPEPIPDRYFEQEKKDFAAVPRLIWCGYHGKASELMVIADAIQAVQERYSATLTIISDRDPQLEFVKYVFIPYRERTVAKELAKADVFIAPRRFDQPYKFHHTFTKIGLPMAVGLPVIASPMPSYKAAPAIFCSTDKEWQVALEHLYKGQLDLQGLSVRGREYCQQEFSWDRVRQYYIDLFRSLVNTPS